MHLVQTYTKHQYGPRAFNIHDDNTCARDFREHRIFRHTRLSRFSHCCPGLFTGSSRALHAGRTMKFALVFICLMFAVQIISTEDGSCIADENGIPVCSQRCEEGAGKYKCVCLPGYVLSDDKRSCTLTGEEAKLVLASGSVVSGFYTKSHSIKTLLQLQAAPVIDIGFGPGNSLLLVADNGTVVYRAVIEGTSDPVPLIDAGLQHVTGVAVDFVTSNIYLVDHEAGTIIVCTTKGDNCAVIVQGLDHPYSIVLDVRARSLLWSQWGTGDQTGSIHHSSLDGSQQFLFISKLSRPRDLVLDVTVGALFWLAAPADGGEGYVVQSATLRGHIRKDIISGEFTSPSLSVLTDHLYIAGSNCVVVVEKFTGRVLSNDSVNTGDITAAVMYHPVLYSIHDLVNTCESLPCSHLCVPSNKGYRCLCPVDMKLLTDRKCSRKRGVERLLVSGMSGIYEVPIEYTGNHGERGRRLLMADASCLVYDRANKKIFYYDNTQRAIRTVQWNTVLKPSTLFTDVWQAEGMAVDTSSSVLYWSTSQGQVYAGKVDGTFSTQIISDLHKPRGITVDPENGYMYICDWGQLPRILRCHMDGTLCDTFILVDGGHPNMVVIATPIAKKTGSQDTKKTLYWTDSKLDMIGYISLDDGGRGKLLLNQSRNTHPYSIVVTNTRIYYSDLNTRHLHYIEKSTVPVVDQSLDASTGMHRIPMVMDVPLGAGSLYGMDHTLLMNVVQTVCSLSNGDCTHICLLKPKGQRTCMCPNNGGNNNTCPGDGTEKSAPNVITTPVKTKLQPYGVTTPVKTKLQPYGVTTPVNYKLPVPYGVTTPVNYKLPVPYGVTTPVNYKLPVPYGVATPVNYKLPVPYGVTTPVNYKLPVPYGVTTPVNYKLPVPYGVTTPVNYKLPVPYDVTTPVKTKPQYSISSSTGEEKKELVQPEDDARLPDDGVTTPNNCTLSDDTIAHESLRDSTSTGDPSTVLLVIVLLSAAVVLPLIVFTIVYCYQKSKKRRPGWMFKFVRYMKADKSDDTVGLVSDSVMSVADPDFKQFDDIDYPMDCVQPGMRRETSLISTDSAFNEMKDFDAYCSIDNISKSCASFSVN